MDMLRSIGKQSGGIRGLTPEEEKEGYGGMNLLKNDDELMEMIEKVPLKELGESELERLVHG